MRCAQTSPASLKANIVMPCSVSWHAVARSYQIYDQEMVQKYYIYFRYLPWYARQMTDMGNSQANKSAEIIDLPPPRRGRPKGSKNRRTLLGHEYLRSLCPKAKKRLGAIIMGDNDELALKALTVALQYTYGKPVEAREISGPDGKPIATEQVDDLELARHVAHLLKRGDNAVSDETRNRGVPAGFSPATAPEVPAGPVTTTNTEEAPVAGADESPAPPAEPVPPPEGSGIIFMSSSQQQLLETGIVKVVGCPPVRPSLPVIYELHSGRRGIHQRGSWQLLLPHLRRVLGLEDGDAWPAWKVEREAKPAEPARHDQMPLPPPKPEVRRHRPR